MFKITDAKGFHVTFANGWTLSVQFGRGNYCDNYGERQQDDESYEQHLRRLGKMGSSTAEIALIQSTGELAGFPDGDAVKGQQTPEQVLDWLSYVAALPKAEATK